MQTSSLSENLVFGSPYVLLPASTAEFDQEQDFVENLSTAAAIGQMLDAAGASLLASSHYSLDEAVHTLCKHWYCLVPSTLASAPKIAGESCTASLAESQHSLHDGASHNETECQQLPAEMSAARGSVNPEESLARRSLNPTPPAKVCFLVKSVAHKDILLPPPRDVESYTSHTVTSKQLAAAAVLLSALPGLSPVCGNTTTASHQASDIVHSHNELKVRLLHLQEQSVSEEVIELSKEVIAAEDAGSERRTSDGRPVTCSVHSSSGGVQPNRDQLQQGGNQLQQGGHQLHPSGDQIQPGGGCDASGRALRFWRARADELMQSRGEQGGGEHPHGEDSKRSGAELDKYQPMNLCSGAHQQVTALVKSSVKMAVPPSASLPASHGQDQVPQLQLQLLHPPLQPCSVFESVTELRTDTAVVGVDHAASTKQYSCGKGKISASSNDQVGIDLNLNQGFFNGKQRPENLMAEQGGLAVQQVAGAVSRDRQQIMAANTHPRATAERKRKTFQSSGPDRSKSGKKGAAAISSHSIVPSLNIVQSKLH
ncbi:hypothetical protein CEUSTIGMA_g8962.t1 [Chlamydomonas eustigma]|uniref:Uncharacterized protein n=1 Tax=Chlamydomonas eustigma TaxID=1157962 RepID=A0A250XEM1_9CHLO|nr:hypothetical protein CEUSTIGMA_g8962.t1 [Chlamydomonas eustigma]|eukprot:GAX81534.1 hypothetical protein CEUSTIGMA_g8962.t1 [Chlamydomonas eustigma]